MHRVYKKEALEAIAALELQLLESGDDDKHTIEYGGMYRIKLALEPHWNMYMPKDREARPIVGNAASLAELREAVELIQPPKLG